MTSYQKLKNQNRELQEEIRKLVMNPTGTVAMETAVKWRHRFEMGDWAIYGSHPISNGGGGLIDFLAENTKS